MMKHWLYQTICLITIISLLIPASAWSEPQSQSAGTSLSQLQTEYQHIEAELAQLEARQKQYIRFETPLAQREAYVKRILDLLAQLATLEEKLKKTQKTMGESTQEDANGVYILSKIVTRDVYSTIVGKETPYEKDGLVETLCLSDYGCQRKNAPKNIVITQIEQYPLTIRPDKPFEFIFSNEVKETISPEVQNLTVLLNDANKQNHGFSIKGNSIKKARLHLKFEPDANTQDSNLHTFFKVAKNAQNADFTKPMLPLGSNKDTPTDVRCKLFSPHFFQNNDYAQPALSVWVHHQKGHWLGFIYTYAATDKAAVRPDKLNPADRIADSTTPASDSALAVSKPSQTPSTTTTGGINPKDFRILCSSLLGRWVGHKPNIGVELNRGGLARVHTGQYVLNAEWTCTESPDETKVEATIDKKPINPVYAVYIDGKLKLCKTKDGGGCLTRGSIAPPQVVNVCKAEAQFRPKSSTAMVKVCNPNASIVYSGCATLHCVTDMDLAEHLRKHPEYTKNELIRQCTTKRCNKTWSSTGLANDGACAFCPAPLSYSKKHRCCV